MWLIARLKSTMISPGLLGVKGQVVVGTPHGQVLDLVPVGRLVVPPSDGAFHPGVICKLHYGVRAVYRNAVAGEEEEEEASAQTGWKSFRAGCHP